MSRQLLYRVACSAVCAAAFLAAPTVEAQVFYNDGGVHVINGPSDKIEILNGPGNAPTTVTVEAPAVVGASSDYSVNVRDSSVFNMTGGTLFDELFMFNNSTATISGGQIGDDITTNDNASIVVHYVKVLDDVEATGNSLVTIYDGDFDEDVEAYNSAVVNIFGGMFQTGSDGANIEAADNSTINIHGGAFGVGQTDNAGAIAALNNGTINIYGGAIGGQPEGLVASGNGVINIHGFDSTPASLRVIGDGQINILDGPLASMIVNGNGVATLQGSDGSLTAVNALDSATIKIFGSNFSVFGAPIGFGPIPFVAGSFSGTLKDGQMLTNVTFSRNFTGGAQIVLVPEPTAAALGLLSVAGLAAVRRRRR